MKLVRPTSWVLMLLLAGCAGGGSAQHGVVPPASGPTSPKAAQAQAKFSIAIPLAGRTGTAAARRPAYVSPNTQSVGVQIVSSNGQPYSGQQPASIPTGPNAPNCTSNGSTLTCSGTIVVPVGSDVLSVTATDGGSGSGVPLSLGQVTAQISPTAANDVSVALGGVVAGVTISFPAGQPAPGTARSIPLTVAALDCSGATIVGPEPYATPIGLSNSDTSGSTSLSTTTVNAPTDTVSLTWDGSNKLQYAAITGTVPAASIPCGNRYPAQAGYFLPHPEPPYLWASQHSSNSTVGPYGWLIGYPLAWLRTGGTTVRPGPVIVIPGTNINRVGVDRAGNVYTDYVNANGVPGVYEFAPDATFAATPSATIPYASFKPADGQDQYPAGIDDLTVDPAGTIYLVRHGYVTSANTNAPPDLLSLAGPNHSAAGTVYHDKNDNVLNAVNALAADGNGNVFSANASADNPPAPGYVFEFGPRGMQTVPLPQDSQGNRQNAAGFGFDGQGNIDVALQQSGHGPSVARYPVGAFPAGPASTFAFDQKYLNNSSYSQNALGTDAQGYVYTNSLYGTISVFAPGASGTALPVTSFQCCSDPTTSNGQIAVPAGLVPPANGARTIAVQP